MRPLREPETTARNLRLIREARARRGGPIAWAEAVEQALTRNRGFSPGPPDSGA